MNRQAIDKSGLLSFNKQKKDIRPKYRQQTNQAVRLGKNDILQWRV